MMKKSLLFVYLNVLFLVLYAQENVVVKQAFVSSDIDNFWLAYDNIIATEDSALQYAYLQNLYLDKGTEGLQSLLKVRNYRPKDFIDAIHQYPEFWKSLRKNSLQTQTLYAEIEKDIEKLRKIYPDLQTSTIYFLVGAFRTNGTIEGNKVLIGSELALGDETTFISEFPEYRQKFYREFHPKANIALLSTHEYVHTQQKEPLDNLLSYCLYEGVAEFVSCLATGKKSNTPAIDFGKLHSAEVLNQFLKDFYFSDNLYNWLWGESTNEWKVRDLGYYIGYEICERYYNQATDKKQAIKTLITLDYHNEKEVERIIDQSKVFPKTLHELWQEYEKKRPKVVKVAPFSPKKKKVAAGILPISITFSEEMDVNFRGFDYGPLGADFVYELHKIVGWRNDNKTFVFEVKLKPNQRYQSLISSNFRNKQGQRLQPFLMDFETKAEAGE